MFNDRFPWQEQLAIIDRTMRAISAVTDPEEIVGISRGSLRRSAAGRRPNRRPGGRVSRF